MIVIYRLVILNFEIEGLGNWGIEKTQFQNFPSLTFPD